VFPVLQGSAETLVRRGGKLYRFTDMNVTKRHAAYRRVIIGLTVDVLYVIHVVYDVTFQT